MEKDILITVFMPVYNREKYVRYAIESILNQTYKNFELIILDDGSTDNSLSVIQSYNDDRIKIITNKINRGVAAAGNQGIHAAKGKYFARLDSDDIAHPNRLETQLQFLEQNSAYAFVGTQAKLLLGDNNTPSSLNKINLSLNPDILQPLSLFYCPVIQGSMMVRTNIIKQYKYDESMFVAEDYDLWTRMLRKHRFFNLEEYLFYCRLHQNNISNTNTSLRLKCLQKVYQSNLEYIQMPYTKEDLDIYLKISGSYQEKVTLDDLKKMEKWLVRMQTHLIESGNYNINIIQEVIGIAWYRVCLKNVKYVLLKGYLFYLKSKLTKMNSKKNQIYLFLHTVGNYPLVKPLYDVLKQYFLSILKVKN